MGFLFPNIFNIKVTDFKIPEQTNIQKQKKGLFYKYFEPKLEDGRKSYK